MPINMDPPEKCCDTQLKVLSTPHILSPPLQESINKIIEREGYITHKTSNRAITTTGGNYLAELFEVDIKGKTAEGEKEINIFIKNKAEDAHVTVIDVEECYSTENFFYGELSKLYDDVQNKANIPIEERYAMVKSYESVIPDAVILENLAKKGFTTIHRMEVAPLRFAQLAIQQLARFHGLSWVMEKQYPEYFARKIKTIPMPFKFNDDYQNFIENMAKYTDKCVDEDFKPKLAKLRSRSVETIERYYTQNAKGCLCHGDYRANNILVKRDGHIITEVIPVDYQLLYYGCPVMDFIYFIFPCTDQEFRRKHLDDLKDLYYDSLTKFLDYFDMDVNTVFSRSEFDAEFKKRLDYGLIVSLMITPILFTDDNDIPDLTKDDFGSISVTPHPKMDDRIRGVVDDFEKWGIL